MNRRHRRLLPALVAGLILAAAVPAAWAASCATLISRCATMSDKELLTAAQLPKEYEGPTHLGLCYFEDRTVCPGCTYDNYVKVAYLPWERGYQGGGSSGAVEPPDPEGKQIVAQILRDLCLKGQCCCPKIPAKACPLGGPVPIQDVITGACCWAPNPCSIPQEPGWVMRDPASPCSN